MDDLETTSHLARRLNADWDRLAADRRVAARLARRPIAGHDDLRDLLAATGTDRSVPMPVADALLAEVIRHAATDELAARVVLQRVLSGLVRIATRRTQSRPELRRDLFEELTASAWLVIRTYPLHRRPVKIAVNILRDTEYQLCVRPARLKSAGEVATPRLEEECLGHAALDGQPVGAAEPPAELQVVALLRLAALAGLPDGDVDLLREVYIEGRPLAELARARGCTVRTIYNRRESATRRLGELATAA
jgi:DNA-directed RNA polymerase specialized sigma24 family protein